MTEERNELFVTWGIHPSVCILAVQGEWLETHFEGDPDHLIDLIDAEYNTELFEGCGHFAVVEVYWDENTNQLELGSARGATQDEILNWHELGQWVDTFGIGEG